jgi:hypothetical protein
MKYTTDSDDDRIDLPDEASLDHTGMISLPFSPSNRLNLPTAMIAGFAR